MAHDTNHIINIITDALDRDFDVTDYDIDGPASVIAYYDDATHVITITSR